MAKGQKVKAKKEPRVEKPKDPVEAVLAAMGGDENTKAAIRQMIAQRESRRDMINTGIELEVCGEKRRIRAVSGGYEELIVGEVAKIAMAFEGLDFQAMAFGKFTWPELAGLIQKITGQASGSVIRILQLIFQYQPKKAPPDIDPSQTWVLSEDDIRWGIDARERALILEVFFRVQWGWVSRLKNWVGQVTEAGTGTPES